MSNAVEITLAIVAAATGGGGIMQLLTVFTNRQKQKTDDSKQFRDELREQANSLRTQVDALKDEIKEKEEEMDEWKEKYWKLYVELNLFKVSVNAVLTAHNIDPDLLIPPE